jgi:FMN phosphatase YigB (HAD superfamily)
VKIEAVLFDLGKVLIDFTFEDAVAQMHSCSALSRQHFEDRLWDKSWIRRYERGEITLNEYHSYLCDNAQLRMEFPAFCQTWSSIFRPGLIVSEDLLIALKKNYPLILVSNTNEAHVDFIRDNYPVFQYFDHLIFSHVVGSLKPDSRIFKAAIEAASRPPQALFFTDDREENIAAARQLGIHAHQFVSEEKLVQALLEAGVEVGDFVQRYPLPR